MREAGGRTCVLRPGSVPAPCSLIRGCPPTTNPPYLRLIRSTSISRFCRSLGLIPGIRDACPNDAGRTALNLCRASVDSDNNA